MQTNFYGLNSISKSKGPSNNVKLQSDKTLNTQIIFFLIIKQMKVFFD